MNETAQVNPVRKQAYTIEAVHCHEAVLMSPLTVVVSQLGCASAWGPGSDSSADESEGGGFVSLIVRIGGR